MKTEQDEGALRKARRWKEGSGGGVWEKGARVNTTNTGHA